MRTNPVLAWLYLLNASVLITHQIDAAYWHEWVLFGIPGGVQVFLLLNLPLAAVILYGFQALSQGRASGVVFSWILVACGFTATVLHSYFLLQGSEAFTLPVSLGLLVATFILSVMQAVSLLKVGSNAAQAALPAEPSASRRAG